MRVRREVGDPPVVVVTEAAGAVAPVSDVVWFHLEISVELSGDERTPGSEIPQSESLTTMYTLLISNSGKRIHSNLCSSHTFPVTSGCIPRHCYRPNVII